MVKIMKQMKKTAEMSQTIPMLLYFLFLIERRVSSDDILQALGEKHIRDPVSKLPITYANTTGPQFLT